MDNAMQHWEILQGLGSELANKVREFMVIGEKGDGVIVATEDGLGYWMGEMKFGTESKQATKPTRLDIPNLVCMSHGYSHILLLNESGQIYGMGKNDKGQIELENVDEEFGLSFSLQSSLMPSPYLLLFEGLKKGRRNADEETPFSLKFISSPHKFIFIRCGYGHSVALTEDGKVWAWGYNYYGQVGVSDSTKFLSSLNKISDLDSRRVVAIECGGYHSLALTDKGKVYGWGLNGYGQLGDGSKSSKHTLTKIPTPSCVKSMAAGNLHTLLLTQTGEVYACGRNDYGQLGLPTTTKYSYRLSKVVGLPSISQIASHPLTHLSIALSSDQRCFVWGELANEKFISTPRELPPIYSTVESPFCSFSTYHNTPHSITLPAKECPHITDTTTQIESCSDSVPDQTMPLPNPILERMFNNPNSSPDVRFQVGDQTILAHRIVLQTTSGHFHRLFSSNLADLNPPSSVTSNLHSGPNPTRHTTNPSERETGLNPTRHTTNPSEPETGPNSTRHTTNPSEPNANFTQTTPQWPQDIIPILDHSYPAFYAYLRYLYLGILEVAPEHLADLFSLSVAYLESPLQQLCISRMRSTLSTATCCLYYQLTHRHSLPELSAFQQELVQFISTRTSEVYRTDAYLSMDDRLCKKLSISMANLHSC